MLMQAVIFLVQALVALPWRDLPRLWLVTRGAQAVGTTPRVSPAQAPLLGLGRTIAMEHPALRCTRIDLDPGCPANEVIELRAELLGARGGVILELRPDGRWSARLGR